MRQDFRDRLEKDFQQSQASRKLPEVRNNATKVLQSNRDKIPWDIIDHGSDHADSVANSVDQVNDVLEDTSLVKAYLGRDLTPKERFEDQAAAYLHDIGRSLGEKSHAQRGAEYTMKEKALPLDNKERERIARLVELHSDGATRKKYGTEDLTELARKGLISKEEAIQATSLRIADALEAGKERSAKNSRGETRLEVTKKIASSMSLQEANSKLSHWIGHSGFDRPEVSASDGKFKLRVRLDDQVLKDHGGDVAFRMKDLAKDVSSTLVTKNFRIDFVADKRQDVLDWLARYGDIMAEELQGVDTRVGGKD